MSIDKWLIALIVIVAVAGMCFFNECISINRHYEYCWATVTAVSVGEVTAWNDKNRTYVRYRNGIAESHVGILGKVGEEIKVKRDMGTVTWLGLMGDYTYKQSRKLLLESEGK